MTVVLALAASLSYGLSDFIGGLVSRRVSAWSVAIVATALATVTVSVASLWFDGSPSIGHLGWGAVAGVGNAAGTAALYHGLGAGRMSVVAPLSAVGSALLPVIVGVATGERPSAATWIGVVVAFPAIWLIARGSEHDEVLGEAQPQVRPQSRDVLDGLLAGSGFGLLFVGLGQIPEDAGLAPLALSQGSATVMLVIVALIVGQPLLPRGWLLAPAVIPGVLGGSATLLFLIATQSGLLTVASVLTSLYPASTVMLAALILREHITRWQGMGLGLAAAAVGLVASG